MPAEAALGDRLLGFGQAINEALDSCLAGDPRVYLMGLGVPDPKGVFGTTLGLAERHGGDRVMDMPTSENAMTGVAIGSAIVGMRPVLTHQRIDFALLAMEQMVGQAAKWHSMFGGRMAVPLVIRLIVGRGWGQGPQHSQSLQAFFAHVPGLKVVMPATPHDAKGLLIAAVEDDNPVIYIEHRWLHGIEGPVPQERYTVPIGPPRLACTGDDLTAVASSWMTVETMRAARALEEEGISVEVVDLRTVNPLEEGAVIDSVSKTGRLLVVDNAWPSCGVAAEVLARVFEAVPERLRAAPQRLTLPAAPTPTSRALTRHFYPRAETIANRIRQLVGRPEVEAAEQPTIHLDVPDRLFKGPF